MKKFLTVLLAVLALVSMFAAEKPFTVGPNVTYTGTVEFSLYFDKYGVDMLGQIKDPKVELKFSPTSDTQAGAEFDISFTPFKGSNSLSLKSISFKTPYFEAKYWPTKQFVSPYFTGQDKDGKFDNSDFGKDFEDTLKVTLPVVKDLEFYYIDRKSTDAADLKDTDAYFSDMILAKYTMPAATPLTNLEIVGGLYEAAPVTAKKYEMGAVAKARFNFGIVKPSVEVFGGYTQEEDKVIYSVFATAEIKPVDILTITPELKYTEKLELLDYKNAKLEDGQYVQANISYKQTFKPVTLTASVTPKYEFGTPQGTPTVALDELSAKVEYAPVTFEAKLSEKDLIDSKMEFALYTKATFKAEMFSVTGQVEWADIMKFDQYKYIHVNASATVDALKLDGNFRMITTGTDKMGYNVIATYYLVADKSVYLQGFFGNLTKDGDGNYTVIGKLDDPTWWGKLVYTKSF